MAKITILFGVLLILLGGFSYVLTGHKFPTSLIPVAFGVLLVIFGSLAETPETRRRMLFMHIAVTVGYWAFSPPPPLLYPQSNCLRESSSRTRQRRRKSSNVAAPCSSM